MLFIPAIDLRGGKVVRLLRGNYDQETQYDLNAVDVAKQFEAAGAELIHIVDLDGARDGQSHNYKIINEIASKVNCKIECGGGIRTIETARELVNHGVERIIIGTKATDKELVKEMVKEFGAERVVIGVDAENGIVKMHGWLNDSGIEVDTMCKIVLACGIKHIIYTDISRDGTLSGPNLSSLSEVLSNKSLQVIASGGIGSMDDIHSLASLKASNLFGVISGKAIYENKIDLKEAVEYCSSNC